LPCGEGACYTVLPFCRAGSRDQELSETEKQKKIRILETRLRLLEGRPEEEFRSVGQNKLYLLLIYHKKVKVLMWPTE
jgi:hypothetical protein